MTSNVGVGHRGHATRSVRCQSCQSGAQTISWAHSRPKQGHLVWHQRSGPAAVQSSTPVLSSRHSSRWTPAWGPQAYLRRQVCVAASSTTPGVAVLGIGLMGNKIARRLAEEGFAVTAWNRDASKAAPLAEAGIRVAQSVPEALALADVVLLLLADAPAIEATLLQGEAAGQLQGKTIVQMGTIGPNQSRSIAAAVEQAGAQYMEAPVLGSQPEAAKGTLLVMVGAAQDPADTPAWKVLQSLSKKPLYLGAVGSAAAVKLALNQLIASLTVGFSTSLGLLQRNDVDIDKFMGILRDSALYAPTFDKKLQRMLDRDYANPNFPTKHLLKDIRLFTQEATEAKLSTSLLEGLQEVIASTVERGLDNTDYSAVHDGVIDPR
ncbi:hypothetical protein WJX72_009062 [[Myrmecia] bisecta]|uniref:Uncharacterized protein n=1 Tax=[Myrmecia] bisecta TaxID=41462 RepID=A0AAW1QSR2_9CHLO